MNLDVAETGDRRTSSLAAGLVGVTVRRLKFSTKEQRSIAQTGSELHLSCEKHNDERVRLTVRRPVQSLFLLPLYSEIAVNWAP